ncbi:MAG: alpha/beta fold hydrolase [Deltaproteobacteria bacterium]|nr:alpha/beta fold hydrolase [Deltaproteobacteria bacterium]
MSDEDEATSPFLAVLTAVGRGLAAGGAFVGRQAVAAYRSVDPDVQRHLVQLPLLAYSLFVPRKTAVDPGAPDGHPPVVFVHGLGANRGAFLLMAGYFRLCGRKRTYRVDFDRDGSMDDRARALAAYVQRVCAVTGEPQVDLVAHSLGGLVARLAIAEHRLGPAVRTLVTLGTPHRGTYPARYANTETTRALRPGSELMDRLGRSPLPASLRTVTFWSENDLFVLPADSATLEGAEQIDVTPFTHYSYLIDPRAFRAVWEVLGG